MRLQARNKKLLDDPWYLQKDMSCAAQWRTSTIFQTWRTDAGQSINFNLNGTHKKGFSRGFPIGTRQSWWFDNQIRSIKPATTNQSWMYLPDSPANCLQTLRWNPPFVCHIAGLPFQNDPLPAPALSQHAQMLYSPYFPIALQMWTHHLFPLQTAWASPMSNMHCGVCQIKWRLAFQRGNPSPRSLPPPSLDQLQIQLWVPLHISIINLQY